MLTAGCASLPGGFQTSAFPGDQEERGETGIFIHTPRRITKPHEPPPEPPPDYMHEGPMVVLPLTGFMTDLFLRPSLIMGAEVSLGPAFYENYGSLEGFLRLRWSFYHTEREAVALFTRAGGGWDNCSWGADEDYKWVLVQTGLLLSVGRTYRYLNAGLVCSGRQVFPVGEESYFIPDFGPVVGFGFVKRPVWTNIEVGWFFSENMPYPQGAFGLGFVF
jgi:hypothetical protein